jgi:hypothetical protein
MCGTDGHGPLAGLKLAGEEGDRESGAVGGPSRFILPVVPDREAHQRMQYGDDKGGPRGILRWVHKASGKIMELPKAIISFRCRSKRYEHLERGVY